MIWAAWHDSLAYVWSPIDRCQTGGLLLRTLRLDPRRTAGAAFLTAALGAGAGACGSAPAPDPLHGLSAAAISAKAIANTEAAGSMRVTGKGASAGQSLSFDLTVANGKGCAGTVTESKAGSFRVIEAGASMWVQPDDAFYRAEAARGALVPLAALSGKYLRETPGRSALGSFGSLCRLTPLLTAFKSAAASFRKGAVTTIGGVAVLPLSGGTASMYVTDTSSPKLVKISAPGTTLYYFSRYGAPAPISAPPASEVTDGSRFGF